jgi:hypothetical protein
MKEVGFQKYGLRGFIEKRMGEGRVRDVAPIKIYDLIS